MTILHADDDDLQRLAGESRALADSLKRIAAGLGPTQAERASAPIIDRWSIVPRLGHGLEGIATGHPLLGDRTIGPA